MPIQTSTDSSMPRSPVLRLVGSAEEPLGLFFRPGHNDHIVLCQLLSEGRSAMTGVVFDPGFVSPQEALRTEVQDRKSTRLNSSHANISHAVFCLKKKHL